MVEQNKNDKYTLPKEWIIKSIKELIDNNIIEKPLDGNHGNIHPKSTDYVSNGIPFIMASDVSEGVVNLNSCKFISKLQADRLKKGFSKVDDVLLTHKGTIGNTAIVPKLSTDYIMLTPQVTYYRVKDKDKIYNKYIKAYFDSNYFQNILKNLSGGGTRAYIGIVKQQYLPFVLPSIEEQKYIGNSISDINELIISIKKLISKKKLIKQGAMDELLTGNKRINGFNNKWNMMTLDSITIKGGLVRGPFGGNLKKDFFIKKGYKVYEQKNAIYEDFSIGSYFIDEKKYKELIRFEVNPGDFIVSCSGTIGRIYRIPNNAPKGVINQALLKIVLNNDVIDEGYFKHYFSWHKFQNEIIESTQGGAMKNLVGMDVFKNTSILVPTLDEQQIISEILTDMDKEIKNLELKLNKYKNIKNGMMEELLTGRRRLI